VPRLFLNRREGSRHQSTLPLHFQNLVLYQENSANANTNASDADEYEKQISSESNLFPLSPRRRAGSRVDDGGVFLGGICELVAVMLLWGNGRSRIGWSLAVFSGLISFVTIVSAAIGCFPGS
jgi:hypothetical protein